MSQQPFSIMPGQPVQLSSHAPNGAVCVWATDGHVIDDDVCFNGKDICVECCAKAGGCCYDPDVDPPRCEATAMAGPELCGSIFVNGECPTPEFHDRPSPKQEARDLIDQLLAEAGLKKNEKGEWLL